MPQSIRAGSDAPTHMLLDGAALENLELLENSTGGTAGGCCCICGFGRGVGLEVGGCSCSCGWGVNGDGWVGREGRGGERGKFNPPVDLIDTASRIWKRKLTIISPKRHPAGAPGPLHHAIWPPPPAPLAGAPPVQGGWHCQAPGWCWGAL